MTELFLPEADAEFREAVRYYESEAPGLGLAFAAEVRNAVSEIIANPKAATPLVSRKTQKRPEPNISATSSEGREEYQMRKRQIAVTFYGSSAILLQMAEVVLATGVLPSGRGFLCTLVVFLARENEEV